MTGFFETYKETSGAGLAFVGKEEKEELIKNATPFLIEKVIKGPSKFGPVPRYIVLTTIDGEARALSFAAEAVESRDMMLDALIDYLQDETATPPEVYLERVDRSILVRDANSEE